MNETLHTETPETVTRPTLRVSYDADLDLLLAITPSAVIDGQPDDEIDEPLEGVVIFHRGTDGPVIGFAIEDVTGWDVLADEEPELWDAPRFDVPTLGLTAAPIGEIVLAAQTTFTASTPDVVTFDHAVATGERGDRVEAEGWWRLCLATGDLRAHFGLGYTLVELDRPREAFGHLRTYTELVPHLSWAWLWRGRAAQAMGERHEARLCFERAVAAEEAGSYETDAAERLAELEV